MIHYLSKANPRSLRGSALLRLDFNTEDDWRMEASLPTIRFLLRYTDKIVIMSHRGRPKGFDHGLSLEKNARQLARLLRRSVQFIGHFNFQEIRGRIAQAPPRSVIVLENLRFVNGEESNDRSFAQRLASLGDFYVNDAFAVSHRANASVAAITEFLPSYAGLELEREITNLSKVMRAPKKPLVVILGGAKIADKLGVIRYFKNKADAFLIGGALANTLLALQGIDVGKSVIETHTTNEIRNLNKNRKINLPIDFKVENDAWLDIGVRSIQMFTKKIERARMIIWNGPMGIIERKRFIEGTRAMGNAIAKNTRAFRVAGGGETVSALRKLGLYGKMDFVSTGGGAMLEFLAGEKLPGIEALHRKSQ